MKPSYERKEDHRKSYLGKLAVESEIDKIFSHESLKVYEEPARLSVYETSAFIHLSGSLEEIELEMIPAFSSALGVKWSKEIDQSYVTYNACLDIASVYIYIILNLRINSTCLIKAIPTGRIKKVAKDIWVDEPIYEYLVDCSDPEDTPQEPEEASQES